MEGEAKIRRQMKATTLGDLKYQSQRQHSHYSSQINTNYNHRPAIEDKHHHHHHHLLE